MIERMRSDVYNADRQHLSPVSISHETAGRNVRCTYTYILICGPQRELSGDAERKECCMIVNF